MANIDKTKREVPYSGEDRPIFQRKMGEYRRIRNLLNKAAGAARRRGDATGYISLVDTGAKRGIQVGGTDSVERMRQTVLGQMDREKEGAIENEGLNKKIKALGKKPMKGLNEKKPPKVNVIPPGSDEEKEALQQSPLNNPDYMFGLYDPNETVGLDEGLRNKIINRY
jgi:hypothetical protein